MRLLERAGSLDALVEYAQEAAGGASRLVLVAGEAGIGKSALVEALRENLTGVRWVAGASDGAFTPLPLGPLFDVAREVGGELDRLCREGAARPRLFVALLDELVAYDGPTVLVLEDAHWADEATLDLVRFLARRLRDAPVMVVVTYRDDGLSLDHPLRAVLGELATNRSVRRVNVPALTPAAVRLLTGGSGMDADSLHALTAGNPFLVTEVLASGAEEVPPSAREAVLARVGRLSRAARQVLEAAAVIGMRVEVEVLHQLCCADIEVIEECLTSGALISEERGFRFRHELARRAVEESIPVHRAIDLHRRALATLLDRGGEDAAIAHHADHAGDDRAVLEYAPRAAVRASSLGAHTEAVAHYQCALRHADDAPADERAALFSALADEAAFVDRWPEAASARRSAIQLFAETEDRYALGTQWRRMATAQWRLCHGDACAAAALSAVEVLEPLGASPQLAGAYATLASVLATHDPSAALDFAQKAMLLADRLDQPAFACTALQIRAALRTAAGEDGFEDYTRARELAVRTQDASLIGSVFANAHESAVRSHRFGLAQRHLEEGLEFTQDHEIDTFTSCLYGWHAAALAKLGCYEEALSILCDVLARRHVSPANRLYTMPTLAVLRGRRGEAGATAALEEASALVAGNGEPPLLLTVALTRAELAWLDGRPGEAVDAVRQALPQLPAVDGWDRGLALTWARRLGLSHPEDVEVAGPYALHLAGQYRAAAGAWLAIGCPYDAALALYDQGEEAALREAAQILDRLGAPATLHVVRARMRELGITQVPRGMRAETRADAFGLTRREREVLNLLCTGRTNAEIATALVLSQKTIDHHVSAVLAKMGVSSRRDAARKARGNLDLADSAT